MPTPAAALQRAIDCFATQRDFAAALTSLTPERPVSSQAVSQWKEGGVPEDRCEPIETATAGRAFPARCEDLRPDLQWQRDAEGRINGYLPPPVEIVPTSPKPKRRRAKA